jgi:formylglycine-generating enzyme required for sulfatase activity
MDFEISPKTNDQHLNWYEADEYCKSLGNDWRMPTIDELRLIFESDHDLEEKYYWASNENNYGYGWAISMKYGHIMYDHKRLSQFYVRPVKNLVQILNEKNT